MSFLQREEAGYTKTVGKVRYLDDRGLRRPFRMSPQQLVVMGVFIIAAVVVGAFVVYRFYDAVYVSASRTQETVNDNLTREVSYDIPVLTNLATLTDDEILASFEEAGLTIYDDSDEDDEEGGLDLFKVPSDMELEEAAELYEAGISTLDAVDASMLLHGSWTLSVDRSAGVGMVVRYCDFVSGDLETAVTTAIELEGFDTTTASEIDEDDNGNTYSTGTVEVGGTEFTWRVSAIALSEVYDISGLPDDALYVGIRIS